MNEKTLPQTGELTARPFQWRRIPPHRILLVEDDGDIRRLNAEVLIHSGYRVDSAEDGAVAWTTLQQERYDLVITDNEMPKVTGIDLLMKIHEAKLQLPVIMATGQLPEAEFNRQPWLYPAAVLLKPYTTEEFLVTVERILRATDLAQEKSAAAHGVNGQPGAVEPKQLLLPIKVSAQS